MSELFQTFLEYAGESVVSKGFWQILMALGIALLVVVLSEFRRLGLTKEISVTLLRGFIQILAAGAIIGVLLSAPFPAGVPVLLGMVLAAAWISKGRGEGIPGIFGVCVVSIGVGAGLVIAMGLFAGAIESEMRDLIVIGSMVIANAMKMNSLALERFSSDVTENYRKIETALSVGASPTRAIREYVSCGVYAALIPILDSIKSLGIVAIPGLMAGMIISGANPIYAAQYQFVIMLMLFAAGGLTTMASTILISHRVFTEAKQLDRVVLAEMDRGE